jgi:hypothetical protein
MVIVEKYDRQSFHPFIITVIDIKQKDTKTEPRIASRRDRGGPLLKPVFLC